jgi:D-alanine--poly(phosphoribitol) ligase subunit 1
MDLLARIESWAVRCPDRLAHVSPGGTLTYRQLAERSATFASYLQEAAPHSKKPVAILGHKESDMLVGFLACASLGRPYIPLDTSLPTHRIEAVLATADASLFSMQDIQSAIAGRRLAEPITLSSDPNDIWYIIFTSGSTGQPKGVTITRGCLESFVDWVLAEQKFLEMGEVFLNQAPFSFDLSVMDLYSSLATGGTLFSVSQAQVARPRDLFAALAESRITTWVSTPSFARFCLAEPKFTEAMLPEVRRFWFCGETLAPDVARGLLKRFPQAEVWNTYGPTEATVATTSIRVTETVLAEHNPLPVGFVKPGTKVMIEEAQGKAAAPGNRGEIVIAGPNVGLGYINRPDLTAKAFFKHEGHRAYRTGDWGHFEGKVLFFEGRIDFQIKLHGYRIEIGDIEANLRQLTAIHDAVVLPAPNEARPEYLVAFLVLSDPSTKTDFETAQELRSQLADRLPDYMVPRRLVFMEAFPTTPNGKIDRRELAQTIK